MQLQAWLALLCRMIPGIRQALLQTGSSAESESQFQWPESVVIDDDVTAAASLAGRQQKTITTMLTSTSGKDTAVDMVIAIPLKVSDDFTGTLAILVNIKPSQQTVVTQLMHWGEDWLQLILQNHEVQSPVRTVERDESRVVDKVSGFWSNYSRRILLAFFIMMAVLSMVNGDYRVSAPASLEGKIQRVIVAPFDGYIASANARAGENVSAGDVIAELDSKDLLLQKQRYMAEKTEHTRQYRQALVSRDKAQAHIYKSQVTQADAQIQLLEKKIQRSILVAPLDGVIIRGDLSRSLGAHVDTGDVLFEVAPLDAYRLVIFVDEKQVVEVKKDYPGILNLKALPSSDLAFVVEKVSPVFEEDGNGISYRVEARLEDKVATLRPGMQGVAKIEIERRSYAWIYLHEIFDVVRLWFWSWLP